MSPKPAKQKRSILVVDDHEDNRELLGEYLTHAGFEVRLAQDGAAAIAAIDRACPSVVILDLAMPMVDGLKVAQHIRRKAETAAVPIIAVTGATSYREQALSAGCDSVMFKPVELAELLAEVRRVSVGPGARGKRAPRGRK